MTARFAFAGLDADLVVALDTGIEAGPFADACRLLLPGWRHAPAASASAAIDIAVAAEAQGFAATARSWPGGVARVDDMNNLANAVGGLLVDALLARNPALCCLHAAAIEVDGGAVLCVGRSGVGKSTLALRFAAHGYRIFGDDRVLVDTESGEAVALGFAAKARLPLPEDGALDAFVDHRCALADTGVAYLHLGQDEQAPFSRRVPLVAFCLAERHPDGAPPAAVDRLSPGALAAGLIAEATSPGTAALVVAAITRLTRFCNGFRLRFCDGERAVKAILRETALRRAGALAT